MTKFSIHSLYGNIQYSMVKIDLYQHIKIYENYLNSIGNIFVIKERI